MYLLGRRAVPLQGPHPWYANLAKSTLPVAHGPVPPYLCVFLHSTLGHEIQGSPHWPALPSHHSQEEHRGRQLAFPWRFNSYMSYSVFLAFLCSNYSFKIITNFFLFSKFHLASYTEISCREFKLLDRNLPCHIPPQMVQSALQFMPDSQLIWQCRNKFKNAGSGISLRQGPQLWSAP